MKKSIKRLLAVACALTMAIPVTAVSLSGCGDDGGGTETVTPALKVKAIKLNTSGAKTEFKFGEEFTASGLIVTAVMTDGSEQNVALKDCTISAPDMNYSGRRKIQVTYKGMRSSYEINIAERVMPAIGAEIKAELTNGASFKVEAEQIDMATPAARPQGSAFVAESAEASGGKYLTSYGVNGNYFGFKFTSDAEYTDVVLVFRAMNSSTASLGIGSNMKAYLNYKSQTEAGEIDLSELATLTPAKQAESEEGGEASMQYVWEDRIVRGITIPAGENTLTFDITGENVACLDYVEFYVGTPYEGNRTALDGVKTVTKEFEDFNLEKVKVRADMVAAHNLKAGEVWFDYPKVPTSGDKSVAAVISGTEISTLLCLEQNATVEILLTAAYPAAYKVKDNWEFYIDGELLTEVEDKDIQSGDVNKGEWWNWQDTSLGTVEFEAGNHLFVAKIVGSASANYDCFKFVVKSYGAPQETPEQTPETTAETELPALKPEIYDEEGKR